MSYSGSPCNSLEGICAICLGVPDNKSFASNCLHEFCFICLLEWSKIKAECPLCMQPLCSIIHNVKFDHEYDELEIQKLGKHSSRPFPSPVVLLQRQSLHNSTLANASNPQGTTKNHLQTPTTSGRRQTIHTGIRKQSTVPRQSEKQLIAQNHLAKALKPGERTANVIRYSLRSRTILRDDIDRACDTELVNEFRPISSSSAVTISNMLPVINVTADPAEKVLLWHDFVPTDMRNQMVQKLVVAIISDPVFDPHNHMERVIAYMRRIERDIYMKAYSEDVYFAFCSEKIAELRDMDKTRKRLFLQLFESYEGALHSELNRGTFSQDAVRLSVNPEISLEPGNSHFPIENLKDTEEDDLIILEVPPKPVPEIITLSDSDDD
ncbi:uncharacterized protein LOC130694295 [Daphnia carinata]|uniref:uncharacterized protein LOC130694295 n=1 Tax=Daphnia carinata TaxID=120202 RepID=UPI002579C36D|nr:uncharacterized protein LOC130694295 [Daphnia carinata]